MTEVRSFGRVKVILGAEKWQIPLREFHRRGG